MKFTKDIYFDKNIIENNEVSILYNGKFYKSSSNEVYIVFNYGVNQKNIQEKKMILTSTGFVVDIRIEGKDTFNFHFRDDTNRVDDNNGQDYMVNIQPEKYNVEFGDDLIQFIDLGKSVNNIDDTKLSSGDNKVDDEKSLFEFSNSKEANENIGKKRIKEFEEECEIREISRRKKRYEKDKKRRRRIRLICTIILVFCLTYGMIYYIEIKNIQKENQNLLDSVVIDNIESEDENVLAEDEIVIETERLLKVRELNSQYPDLKAWIEIEGTNINYPVMQGTDNSYYMNHDYKKEYSRWGSLFIDQSYDWSIPSSNLLIYGHNFSDGVMLSDLLKYKDKSFFDSHPTIKFTTPEEDTEYEIIAVFYSRVYYKSEKNVFRYYYFVNAETEAEYNEFVTNAKNVSIYDTGKTAQYGDQLLTLSTCEYSQEDGRFAVVARKKQ